MFTRQRIRSSPPKKSTPQIARLAAGAGLNQKSWKRLHADRRSWSGLSCSGLSETGIRIFNDQARLGRREIDAFVGVEDVGVLVDPQRLEHLGSAALERAFPGVLLHIIRQRFAELNIC